MSEFTETPWIRVAMMTSRPWKETARARSAIETAEKAGLTRETIHRLERSSDIPASRTQSLVELQRIFEEAGIEFIGGPGEGPGVRLWKT